MEEDQGMLSMATSNITTLNGEEGSSDSNSSTNSSNSLGGSSSPSARLKGVDLLPNGSWGTQIYPNRKRTWIERFKSEFEAGKAYDDAAAVKLRKKNEDSPRNCSTVASLETDVRKLLTFDEIKSMRKDGSYRTKLYEFANSCSLDKEPCLSLSLGSVAAMDGDVKCQQLFQKELTPSDVGKLNRLVIHRRFAEKYFPEVSKEEKVPGVIDEIQLSFFDREMKSWNFRYCYWKSSHSYVFTKGWVRFVKEKKLKEKDVVTFYKCEGQNGAQKAFYMIDVAPSIEAETNGGGFDTDAGNRVDLQLCLGQSTGGASDRTIKPRQQKKVAPPQPEEEKKKYVAAETRGFDTDAGNRVDLQLCLGQITGNVSGPSDRSIKLRQQKKAAPPQPEEEKKVVRLFGVNIS